MAAPARRRVIRPTQGIRHLRPADPPSDPIGKTQAIQKTRTVAFLERFESLRRAEFLSKAESLSRAESLLRTSCPRRAWAIRSDLTTRSARDSRFGRSRWVFGNGRAARRHQVVQSHSVVGGR